MSDKILPAQNEYATDPEGNQHVEVDHQKRIANAAVDTLSAARSPWKVLMENKKNLLMILAVQCNAIILGIEFSLPGNVLGINAFLKTMGEPAGDGTYAVQANVLTLWAAMFATFQVLGQISAGFTSDYFGRRVSLYLVIFWSYIGVMLEVIANDWRMWTGSKIVIGFATGMMQSTVPTFVAEVAPRECRAIGLSFSYLCMTFGSLLSTLVTYGTNLKWGADINDNRAFRVPLYIGLAVPTLVLIFELLILVESPNWLIMRGRKDKARANLAYIHSWQKDFDLDRAFAELEYTLEKEAEEMELQKQSSYLDCFKGDNLRRTFCAVFPPMTNNLAGSNLTGQYSTYFFEIAGSDDPLVNSVITTIVGLAANVLTFFTIETRSVGRWGLLFGGLLTMTLSMLSIGLIAEITHGVYSYASGVVLTLFVALFSAASTIGPGVAGFAYTGESGSSRLRAKTTTLGVVGNALVGLIMTTCLPYMLNSTASGGRGWGIKTAWMFFILGFVSCFIVYFFVPEFSGRSYAQLDELFARKVPARKFKDFECTGDYGRDLIAEQ